eukprot:1295219-Rhodomonas_salina.1
MTRISVELRKEFEESLKCARVDLSKCEEKMKTHMENKANMSDWVVGIIEVEQANIDMYNRKIKEYEEWLK